MARYDLNGRSVLITGASGGIGSAGAREFVKAGATVTLVDLDLARVEEVARSLPADAALAVQGDVTDYEQMQQAVEQAVARFGKVDIVWANAGITYDPPTTILGADMDAYEKVIDVDLVGAIGTVKAALPQVVAHQGQVVVTGSGFSMLNAMTNSAYGTSKAGIEMFGRSLRAELATHGASATVLYPPWTRTPITTATHDDEVLSKLFRHTFRGPLGSFSAPEDVAHALVRGVQRRAARVWTPSWWAGVSALRGIVNPLTDLWLDLDSTVHEIVSELERLRADRAVQPHNSPKETDPAQSEPAQSEPAQTDPAQTGQDS